MWMNALEMPDHTLGSARRCRSIDLTELWMLSSKTGIDSSDIVGSTNFLVSHDSSSRQMTLVFALPCEAK